jgi:putative FmdB family regulatory protein
VPLFEYECRSCKAQFEQLVFNTRSEVVCRECGSASVVQLLSTFAVKASSERSVPEPGPCGSCGAAQRGMCGLN